MSGRLWYGVVAAVLVAALAVCGLGLSANRSAAGERTDREAVAAQAAESVAAVFSVADGTWRADRDRARAHLAEPLATALRPALGDTEFAVVGAPHPRLGEVVTVVLEDTGALPDRAALRRAAGEALDTTHRPRRWLVVQELPRTDAGKVARARLHTSLLDGTLPTRTVP